MEARFSAIHRGLLLLLAASLAVAVLARPAPENRRLVRALEEVSSFRAAFDQKAAEDLLRQQAIGIGQVRPQELERVTAGKHGPQLKVAAEAVPVRALAFTSLATLSQIADHARPNSTVAIGVADLDALGSSLLWRLARAQRTGISTVSAVELWPAEVTQEDVALEREVAELRVASLDARAALEEAESRIGILEYRVGAQSKRRSKSLVKSTLALEEAKVTLQQRTQARSDAQLRYEQSAQRAERARKILSAGNTQIPEAAIARVRYAYGSEQSTLDIPIPLIRRDVMVAPLKVTSFPALRAAGMWNAVKDKTSDAAIGSIQARFNWHLQPIRILGFSVNGRWVLELLPCVLPILLALLLRRIHRAEVSYSPFGTKLPRTLPFVGFRNRFLEFLTIIVLPLLGVASAGAALMLNDRFPVVPALSGVACVMLGVYAFAKVRELRDHTLSIMRHSHPPPAGE